MSQNDRAEVLAQHAADEWLLTFAALRQATKNERKFYGTEVGTGRPYVCDAEILTAIGRMKAGGPVNTWLDQVLASQVACKPFCLAVLKVADSLGVEVVR
jgi:hypothetical protein